MCQLRSRVLSAGAAAVVLAAACAASHAAINTTPVEATVTIDASRTLRVMDPRKLGGTNVALWYFPSTYHAPQVQRWMRELRPGFIRMPGGSWSNAVFWNGHGVRRPDGTVDHTRIGPDGFPAIDYSAYAPSILVLPETLHPRADGWHGHSDVKLQHEFIQSIPGAMPLVVPNAGTGRAVDAAEWVRWANHTMGYNVRFWQIGNELGGSWEAGTYLPFGRGRITAEMFVQRYIDMATAMRAVDPTITIGTNTFNEAVLRHAGDLVDFVTVHTYPGSTTLTEAHMFDQIDTLVESYVSRLRGYIRQYQPEREHEIDIVYSEWNLGGGINNARMFSGLWASIFLSELARNGVAIATQWDAFSDLFAGPDDGYARRSQYYALWLWNNYSGNRIIPAESSQPTVHTFASRSGEAVYVMLVNTNPDQDANVNLRISGFQPAAQGELATVTSREYHHNALTRRTQWSTGPRIETIPTGPDFAVTLPPFSMTHLRIPDQARPTLSLLALEALAAPRPPATPPELRFNLPAEMFLGDQIRGEVLSLSAGTELPYLGALPPATLSAPQGVSFDRPTVRLSEAVGHFYLQPNTPGDLVLTARSGDLTTTHTLRVKPAIPRPTVFWDFSAPRVTDREHFTSDFQLIEDLTQRANRAVARIDLPAEGVLPGETSRGLLKVERLPDADRLNRSNIRGVVVDVRTSPDFATDDPDAHIFVVMQSPAHWWIALGSIPLRDAAQWQTHQLNLDVTNEDFLRAMPSAFNIIFILGSDAPVRGSIYLDRIGFMVC